ncbi:hypothetical protein LL973_09630 [Xanthomonas campestris pv. nigromaculans]|nr:hypothetical protein [Xanthomonas campestris pv. nigromaculans]
MDSLWFNASRQQMYRTKSICTAMQQLRHADIQIGEAGDVADVTDMVAEPDKPKSRVSQIYAWTSVCLTRFSSRPASRVFKRSSGIRAKLQIFPAPSCQFSVPGLGLGLSRRVLGKKKPPILLDGGFRVKPLAMTYSRMA